jgi:precorrin-3B methylase
MLRIEKVFEAAGINEELEAYNPLIPDGHNWKATFMVEYADPARRTQRLAQLIGIEDKVWVQVDGCDRVYPIADEDLERANETKTSSVHFLRFELTPGMIAAVQSGAAIAAGIDHPAYTVEPVRLAPEIRDSLAGDLQAAVFN